MRGVGSTIMSLTPPNLYLVGFAGTGKSTIGRLVARELQFQFFDTDHEIEQRHGKPVAQIFAEEGEAAFREQERRLVAEGLPAGGCVVACGGGLVVPAGRLELLRGRGVVVCLHAPVEVLVNRTARTAHRPLLAGEDRDRKVRELFAAREPVYRRAGTMVLTGGRTKRDIAGHVLRVYRAESRDWRPAAHP
jgi:shikimate kinase